MWNTIKNGDEIRHPFLSEDLEPSRCSKFRFIVLMSELSLLILRFFCLSDLQIKAVWGKPWFFSSARLKMQTRCWDEKSLVSSAAGSFSGGRAETDQAAFTSSGELQVPFREKDGTKTTFSPLLWRMGIFCCHETVGHVYIYILCIWLQEKNKNQPLKHRSR